MLTALRESMGLPVSEEDIIDKDTYCFYHALRQEAELVELALGVEQEKSLTRIKNNNPEMGQGDGAKGNKTQGGRNDKKDIFIFGSGSSGASSNQESNGANRKSGEGEQTEKQSRLPLFPGVDIDALPESPERQELFEKSIGCKTQ